MRTKRASKPSQSKHRKSTASEIAPGVFVGGWDDATIFTGMRFCVLDKEPDDMPADAHIPIYDGDRDEPIVENLDRLARLIGKSHEEHVPVLVFCGHGVRRSPLAGAWYLHRSENLPLDVAYERIQSVRPGVEHVKVWVMGWKTLPK